MVGIVGGCQVGAMNVEIDYGSILYSCVTEDVMKVQSK